MIWKLFASKQNEFMDKLFKHLKLREGYKQSVYLDILGKPTCGIGHLLSEEEQEKYPVKCLVPQQVIDNWFKVDTKKAISGAEKQMEDLELIDEDFKIALVSVNYQLGTNWDKKFPLTYQHLKMKNYDNAIQEVLYKEPPAKEPSSWKEQTPVRVEDFVEAIELLKEKDNA